MTDAPVPANCPKCANPLRIWWKHCAHCGNAVTALPSGLRAQVFEVIVRQAMAGAPWRQICVGPMQVNKISPEEIEEEVRRRRGDGPQKAPVPKKPIEPKDGNEVALALPEHMSRFVVRSEIVQLIHDHGEHLPPEVKEQLQKTLKDLEP